MVVYSFFGNIKDLTEKEKQELSQLPHLNLVNRSEISLNKKSNK